MPLISEIIQVINDFAPLSLQESWDNSGLQIGSGDKPCTGVLLCVDVKPAIFNEAIMRNCNLVVSHHPLIFKGLKHIDSEGSDVEQSVYIAINNGITVFSSHTALDSAMNGISVRMAEMIGATPIRPLMSSADPTTGLGCVAEFEHPIQRDELFERIKKVFSCSEFKASTMRPVIKRIGLCGGAGGEFIPDAIAAGCDAYITADVRYHDFLDYGNRILIADIGHFESEECAKQIFYDIISEKFPNFAIYKSDVEQNPIIFI